MLAVITTAGVDTSGPCYAKRDEAVKVLEGTLENDQLFAIIFTIDEDDDWTDWASWEKANPNLGVSIYPDFLQARRKEALQIASRQNILKCKHLNVWSNAGSAWINMEPRPAIDGLSIGYVARQWEPGGKPDEPRRRLKRIELIEISPVTFPANARARVEQVKGVPDIRLAERALREAGFSRTQAKTVLAEGFSALPLRDAEGEGADAVAALLRRNIATIKTSARR